MQIHLYQSGGFAGERIKLKELSDDQLTPEKRAMLNSLLKQSNFFAQPGDHTNKKTPEGFDMLQYEIEVDDTHGTHTVSFQKTPDTQRLNALLDFILSQ